MIWIFPIFFAICAGILARGVAWGIPGVYKNDANRIGALVFGLLMTLICIAYAVKG